MDALTPKPANDRRADPIPGRAPVFVPVPAGERFGRVLATRAVDGFVLRESAYPPALRMPAVYHPDPYFCLVVRGAVHERAGREARRYDDGSLHFHPAGDPHATEVGAEGATCLSIVVAGRVRERLDAAARLDGEASSALARLAARCRRELYARDDASDLALEGFALELVASLLRRRMPRFARTPAWLAAVRERLHAHPAGPLALGAMAAEAGVHPVHLVRAFRARYGAAPGAYLRGLRVEEARRQLASGDRPIAEIALDLGFSSQAHFTRVFREHVGDTPAAWRRARRG